MRHAAFLTLGCLVTPLWSQQSTDVGSRRLDFEVVVQQPADDVSAENDPGGVTAVPTIDEDVPLPAQDKRSPGKHAIRNPFDLPSEGGIGDYGGMMGSGDAMEEMMMDMEAGMGDMGMGGMGSGMGMEGGYGDSEMYGGADGMSPSDRRFQMGLQRAIEAIRKSKSDEEQQTLLGFVRRAFQNRYDESIESRRKQLGQIKQRVAKLEVELKRREAAKSRVVEVQLQSVQLAAEGLLELDGQ